MYDRKSGMNFLERIGMLPTWRNPEPRLTPDSWTVHRLSLTPPLPLPALLNHLDGEPQPPDRGVTEAWPHPSEDTTS